MHKLVFIFCFLLVFCVSKQSMLEETQSFQDGDRRVFIFDELFAPEVISAYFKLVANGQVSGKISSWFYTYSDYYQNFGTLNSSINSPWIASVDPEFFTTTALCDVSRNVVKKLSGGKDYFPYDVCFSMQRRLDFITATNKVTDTNIDEDDLVIKISLNNDFKKNDYAETIFYKDDGEILAAIYPKMGRMIVWNASVPFILKPPAMTYVQAQYDVIVRLSTSKEKAEKKIKETKKLIENAEKQEMLGFGMSEKGEPLPVDISKYEKRRFHDSQGREIAVFDGLVDRTDLDALRLFLLQYNSVYAYQGYDGQDEEHDNVSWIAIIKVKDFIKSRLWKLVKQLATYLSGLDEWYPYDVSMNIIRNSHYPRIHEDCEPHEHEYTFLMYLTPDWEANNYGETVFFEEILSEDGNPSPPGQQQYEWIATVRPRYGRIVIFRGIIPHSARPPSPGFSGARYTFACKVSRNYRLAISKALRETLEYLGDGENATDPAAFELLDELRSNEEDGPVRPTEYIEEQLEKYRQKKKEFYENIKKMTIEQLSAPQGQVKDEL